MFGLPLAAGTGSGVAILHVDLSSLLPLQTASGRNNANIDTAFLAGSVETSSLEALSTQLTAMLMASSHLGTSRLPEHGEHSPGHPRLSKRQLEVLGLLAEGKTNAEIARALSRSPHTIKLHVSAILRQLNVKSRTKAAFLASAILKGQAPVRRTKKPR